MMRVPAIGFAILAAIAIPSFVAADPIVLDGGPTPGELDDALRARGRMHFATDSYELSARDRERIRRVATVLRSRPGVLVYLVGNADERGTEKYNRALSLRRCNAIAAYLERWGVSWDRIVMNPAGESHPILARDDAKAWALNRRVDMVFVGVGVRGASL